MMLSLVATDLVYFQSDSTPPKKGEACSRAVTKLQEALLAVRPAISTLGLAIDLGVLICFLIVSEVCVHVCGLDVWKDMHGPLHQKLFATLT